MSRRRPYAGCKAGPSPALLLRKSCLAISILLAFELTAATNPPFRTNRQPRIHPPIRASLRTPGTRGRSSRACLRRTRGPSNRLTE